MFLFSGTTLLEVLDTLTGALPDWFADSITVCIGLLRVQYIRRNRVCVLVLQSYLPTFVTFLTSWVLVPLLLGLVADMSHFPTLDQYAEWYLVRYFVYLIIAVMFVTTTSMAFSALVESWVSDQDTDSTFSSVFDSTYTVSSLLCIWRRC